MSKKTSNFVLLLVLIQFTSCNSDSDTQIYVNPVKDYAYKYYTDGQDIHTCQLNFHLKDSVLEVESPEFTQKFIVQGNRVICTFCTPFQSRVIYHPFKMEDNSVSLGERVFFKRIPSKISMEVETKISTEVKNTTVDSIYLVKKGDTLIGLSKKLNVSIRCLEEQLGRNIRVNQRFNLSKCRS